VKPTTKSVRTGEEKISPECGLGVDEERTVTGHGDRRARASKRREVSERNEK
jgi:hypothetical protein